MMRQFVIFKISLLVLAVFLPLSFTLADIAPAINYRIFAFHSDNLWTGTETVLKLMPGGRLQTQTTTEHSSSGNCGDILTQFQSRPLDKMVSDGYISKQMRDTLMNFKTLGLKPQQLVLFTQYSDISRAIAEKLFDSNIPEDRTSLGEGPNGEPYVRVFRGSIYVVRGYEPYINESGELQMKHLPVPWELSDALPSKLSRKFDREKIPHIVEIGRAFMEKGVLPGNTKEAVHVLLTYLQNESRALDIPEENVLLSAHFLDPEHTRLFTRGYPLRPLSPELQKELEDDPTTTDFLNRPLPKGKEWAEYQDTVVVGSLRESMKRYPPEDISNRAFNMAQTTGGKVSGAEGLDFFRAMNARVQISFDVQHADFKNIKPVTVRDLGTALMAQQTIASVRTLGFNMNSEKIEKFFDSIDFSVENIELPTKYRAEFIFHLPIDTSKIALAAGNGTQPELEAIKSIVASNIDVAAVKQYPIQYLASVVLALAERIETHINKMGPKGYADALDELNSARREMSMRSVGSFDLETFFDTYKLILASTNELANAQMRQLGGKSMPGMAISFDSTSGPIASNGFNFGVKQDLVQYVHFDLAAIRELRKHFPQYVGRRNTVLRPGIYPYLHKMLLAGGF